MLETGNRPNKRKSRATVPLQGGRKGKNKSENKGCRLAWNRLFLGNTHLFKRSSMYMSSTIEDNFGLSWQEAVFCLEGTYTFWG